MVADMHSICAQWPQSITSMLMVKDLHVQLGGTSLGAAAIVTSVRSALGQRVEVGWLYESETIRGMRICSSLCRSMHETVMASVSRC